MEKENIKENINDDNYMIKCNILLQEIKEKWENKYNPKIEIIVDWL